METKFLWFPKPILLQNAFKITGFALRAWLGVREQARIQQFMPVQQICERK